MQDLEGTSHSSELLYTFPSNMHSLHFSQQAPVCLMTRAQSLGRAGHFSLVHLTSLFRHRHEMQGLSVMSGISIAAPSSSQPATEPVNREGVTASWDSRTKERQSKRRPRTRRQRAPGSSIVTGCQSVRSERGSQRWGFRGQVWAEDAGVCRLAVGGKQVIAVTASCSSRASLRSPGHGLSPSVLFTSSARCSERIADIHCVKAEQISPCTLR